MNLKLFTQRLFVRVNHKNELYFSMISFQNEANGVYVSGINITVIKPMRILNSLYQSCEAKQEYVNLKTTI